MACFATKLVIGLLLRTIPARVAYDEWSASADGSGAAAAAGALQPGSIPVQSRSQSITVK